MLKFILGFIVGGILGFVICAICSAAGTDNRTERTQYDKKIGEDNDRSK